VSTPPPPPSPSPPPPRPAAAAISRESAVPAPAVAPAQGAAGWAVPPPAATPAPTAARRTPRPPDPPDIFESASRIVREYFTGGNTLVRVGIVILFFGVAFLLRYVAEHSHVPIEFRLAGVALGGIVLLALGWWLRAKRPGYALALQGGAIGILYLTVFAGLRIYSLLTPTPAFALLVVLAAFSAALAVLQSSQAFALLAVTGGFLAPILASTGQGDHVVLFSYYAVLNAGILAIAWFKAWRPLNIAGFLFTFVIGTAWGVLKYQPQLFATTEPFLILFFLFYLAIAILFAARQAPELQGYVDGTLVFGTPIVAFGLQSAMLHDRPFALAYSALAVSALYLALAWLLHLRRQASQRLLVEAFMALGVLFLSLAVPLALDGRWSAATWALEGALLVWIGCRQNRLLARGFGSILQFAAGVAFGAQLDSPHGPVPILNSAYLGGAMISAASIFSSVLLQRSRERLRSYEAPLAALLFVWGLLWWLFSGLSEIGRQVSHEYFVSVSLAFFAATAILASALHSRARLSFARVPALCLLPVMVLWAVLAATRADHPSVDGGWAAWPLAFATFYFVCRRHEGASGSALANTLHVIGVWLLVALVSWETAWAINKGVAGAGSWPAIAWALVPAISLFALPRLAALGVWPFESHREAYLVFAGGGLASFLALWSLLTNVMLPGDPYPLRYVPLINPLDIAQMFALLAVLRCWQHVRRAEYAAARDVTDAQVFTALSALTFIWLNAALLRTIHHWEGVPFAIEPMLRSTLVQTALSIFWTVLALATMLAATRVAARVVWLTGAGLLGVVIAKLFLVDLSHIGTIERIVSFVGVGVLMLVIGYFSPLPPASSAEGVPAGASQR